MDPTTDIKPNTASESRRQGLRLLPSVVMVFLSALAIPMSASPVVGGIAVALCSVFLISTARRKPGMAFLIFLLIATFGIPDGLQMITIILSLVVGTGTLSWLMIYTRSPYLAVIPVLAYSVATVITKNWFAPILALSFVFPALALAISFYRKSGRISALCRAVVIFVLTVAAAVILSMYYFRGEFRLDVIKEYANAFVSSIAEIFSGAVVELQNGDTQALFSETEAYNMALRIVTLFPAITVIFFNLISFAAQCLQYNLIRSTMGEKALTIEALGFMVSPGAGIVFTLSFLVRTFTSSTPTGYVIATVCENLYMILLPVLVCMGVMYILAKLSAKRSRPGIWMVLIFGGLIFFNFQLAILLSATFGAYVSIAVPLSNYLRSKISKD